MLNVFICAGMVNLHPDSARNIKGKQLGCKQKYWLHNFH